MVAFCQLRSTKAFSSSCQCFVLPLSEALYQMRVLSTLLSGGIGLKPRPGETRGFREGGGCEGTHLDCCRLGSYLRSIWEFSRPRSDRKPPALLRRSRPMPRRTEGRTARSSLQKEVYVSNGSLQGGFFLSKICCEYVTIKKALCKKQYK